MLTLLEIAIIVTMPKINLEKKARISALLSAGLSTVEISIKEKVSRSTVARIKKRESTKISLKDLPRSGRPRSKIVLCKSRKKSCKAYFFWKVWYRKSGH